MKGVKGQTVPLDLRLPQQRVLTETVLNPMRESPRFQPDVILKYPYERKPLEVDYSNRPEGQEGVQYNPLPEVSPVATTPTPTTPGTVTATTATTTQPAAQGFPWGWVAIAALAFFALKGE
jgi:hypothetical protein